MPALLPTGDLGAMNLPVPVSPSLPATMGDRELHAPTPKIQDGLEPIIMSLDVITEQLDVLTSSDDGKSFQGLTVGDLDKLFQKYFSKKAFSDNMMESVQRQAPPARPTSLLVRQQVKAAEVSNKEKEKKGDFDDIFSKSKKSSKKPGKGAEQTFNEVLGYGEKLVKDPLKLFDDLAKVPFKLIDSLFKGKKDEDSQSSGSKKKGGEPFYGYGESAGGDFFGNSMFPGGGGGGATTEDNLYEEAAEAGIKADKSIYDTFEDPESSAFGQFIGGEGGSGGKGKKGLGDVGYVLIAGMILIALLLFKDVIVNLFERVIIPLGQVVIEVLRAIKDPFIRLVNAVVDVIITVLGIVKDILVAITPYLILMAEAICGIVVVVLNIVKEILIVITPYLILMAEVISGIVVVVLNIILGVLEAIAPAIIAIASFVSGVLIKILDAIMGLIDIITFPLRLVSKILAAIEPHIVRIANFVMQTLAEWFENNADTLNKIFDILAGIVTTILLTIEEFMAGMLPHMKKIGDIIGGIIVTVLESIAIVLNTIKPVLEAVRKVVDALSKVVGGIGSAITLGLDKVAQAFKSDETKRRESYDKMYEGLSEAEIEQAKRQFLGARQANPGLTEEKYLEDFRRNKENREKQSAEREQELLNNASLGNLIDNSLSMDELKPDRENYLRGIHGHTAAILNLLYNVYKDTAVSISQPADDLIVTDDGQIFSLAPGDALMAFDTNALSQGVPNPVSGLFTNPASNSQTNSQVTNNYVSSTNVDYGGNSPFSSFCPVGV